MSLWNIHFPPMQKQNDHSLQPSVTLQSMSMLSLFGLNPLTAFISLIKLIPLVQCDHGHIGLETTIYDLSHAVLCLHL